MLLAGAVVLLVLGSSLLIARTAKTGKRLEETRHVDLVAQIRDESRLAHEADLTRLRSELRSVLGSFGQEIEKLNIEVQTAREAVQSVSDELIRQETNTAVQTVKRQSTAVELFESAVAAAIVRVNSVTGAVGPGERDLLRDRQVTALAGLAQRASRLETAIAAVVHPQLLPGEAFVLPEHVPGDALRWEAWQSVGDAVFALADLFALERAILPGAVSIRLGAAMTVVRMVMTNELYPGLKMSAMSERDEVVRKCAGQLAATVAEVQGALRAGIEAS